MNLYLAATFAAQPLERPLRFWMEKLGLPGTIEFAPTGQLLQPWRDNTVLLLRLEDWEAQRRAENCRLLRDLLQQARAPVLLMFCPSEDPSVAEMESQAASELENFAVVVRSAALSAMYPVDTLHEPHTEVGAALPYTSVAFSAIATLLARTIAAQSMQPCKLLVVDGDGTLWSGICAEDGPAGVGVDEPLQSFLLEQRAAGVLLALCSKNHPDDVEAVLSRPDMLVCGGDFAARRINWQPRSENIRSLATELGVDLRNVVHLDDDAVECAEVVAGCPTVQSYVLPATARARFLRHLWALDHGPPTAEGRRRHAYYQQEARRADAQQQAPNLESFLETLQLEVDITPLEPADRPRVRELQRRTSQFNLRPGGELHTECRVARVRDRFGEYGLVGASMFTAVEESLRVHGFMLSCRALGRGVEHRMLADLGKLALHRGLSRVELRFARTARNTPALQFLESLGSLSDDRLLLPVAAAAAARYVPGPSTACALAEAAAPVPLAALRDIAERLSDIGRIQQEIWPQDGPRPDVAAPYVEPRTETERRLADIFAHLLGLSPIGVHDNFFELGGHSLLGTQVLSRIRDVFGIELPLRRLFTGEFTVAALAESVTREQVRHTDPTQVGRLLQQLGALTDDQVRALLSTGI